MPDVNPIDTNGTPTTQQQAPTQTQDWRAPYTADAELKPYLEKRIASIPNEDMSAFLKSTMNLERRIGTSIVPPGPNATPEEINAFKQKIYSNAGYAFTPPPDHPDKYSLTKPDSIPDIAWSKELESEYRSIFHKYGIPDQAAQELFQTHLKQFNNVAQAYEIDHAQAMESLNTWANEIKANPAEIMAKADDFISQVGKDDPKLAEFIERTKMLPIGHPSTMKLLGTAGLYAAQSSGETGEAMAPGDSAWQLAKQIEGNPSDPLYIAWHAGPNHPRWQEAEDKRNAGYKSHYPGEYKGGGV